MIRFIFEALPRVALIKIIVISLLANIITLMMPLHILNIFDRVLPSKSYETLIALTVLTLLLLQIYGILEKWRMQFFIDTAWDIKGKKYKNFMLTILSEKESKPLAHSDLMRAFDKVIGVLKTPSLISVVDVPFSIIFLAILWALDPYIVLFLIVTLCAYGVYSTYSERRRIRQTSDASYQIAREIYYQDSLIKNISYLKALGYYERSIKSIERSNLRGEDYATKTEQQSSTHYGAQKAFMLILQALTYSYCAYLVLSGEITAGMLFAATILVMRAGGPLFAVINTYRQYYAVKLDFEKISPYLFADKITAPVTLPLVELDNKPTIACKDISFSYDDRNWILKDARMIMQGSGLYSLMGVNASGKTTVLKLLSGQLKPHTGEIFICGRRISIDTSSAPAGLMGIYQQTGPIFPGTLLENFTLSLYGPSDLNEIPAEISDEVIEEVTGLLEEFDVIQSITRLPSGLNTSITENNIPFSTGVLQRFLIARALFKRPRILFLDEPLSNQDLNFQTKIITILKDYAEKNNALIVCATHTKSMIESSKSVLTIAQGKFAHLKTDSKASGS